MGPYLPKLQRGMPLVAEKATGLDPEAIPQQAQSIDWQSLKVSADEGMLLTRIDGMSPVKALGSISGLGQDKVNELLENLVSKGLVIIDGHDSEQMDSDIPDGELEQGIDLDLESQRKILSVYKKLDELTHYQLLNVDRRAEQKEIKRAYFRVSKDYHPDSFFRKDIGTFKSKINALFKAISNAYEVLSNPQKRAAYDATLPYEPTPEEIEEAEKKKKTEQRDARLREERKKRLLRRMPMAKRKAQARQHFENAKVAREDQDILKANNEIRIAISLDPENSVYQDFLKEVAPAAASIRADKEYKRGRYEESMGNDEGALGAYFSAIELNPEEVRALHRAAVLMLGLKRDYKTALTFARKALQLEPDDQEIVKVTADLYLAMEMNKNALREYNRYLNLNPFDEKVVELVKKLRKR